MIDEKKIYGVLDETPADAGALREIFSRSLEARGLPLEDIPHLINIRTPELLEEMFETARAVKEKIYGKRLVIFAPLYISNLCENDCLYCAFRSGNEAIPRRRLGADEIFRETEHLVRQGHKRILLVAGESHSPEDFDRVLEAIDTVYSVKEGAGEVRRINVNIAPLGAADFMRLKGAGIGTYQLFQETYHRGTYGRVHRSGKKSDYDWRITAVSRAMAAGIDDVGLGVLFGLHDWRFEVLALLQHAWRLDDEFGIGPHTISVPRLEPAMGSELSGSPPSPVGDTDFKKIVAILRLAVPYTGIIMSTRESPAMRKETFALGVSQISAGSRTDPGGYSSENQGQEHGQFSLGDHRSLDEVVREIAVLGHIPSFCTACYRLGRTGRDFMDLAKPGDIKDHCGPNALSTFMEYLIDYASPETKAAGDKTVARSLEEMKGEPRERAMLMIDRIRQGSRDVFC